MVTQELEELRPLREVAPLWSTHDRYPDMRQADTYVRAEPMRLYAEHGDREGYTSYIAPEMEFYLCGSRTVPPRSEIVRALKALEAYNPRMHEVLITSLQGKPLQALAGTYQVSDRRVRAIRAQAVAYFKKQLEGAPNAMPRQDVPKQTCYGEMKTDAPADGSGHSCISGGDA